MRLVGEVGPEGRQGRNWWEAGPEGQHVRTQSIKDQGSRASRIKDKDRGSRTRIKDQGSRINDQGCRIKDQGSKMKAGCWTQRPARQDPEDQASRMKAHGPCSGTNEHPRRDTDVILRQSKAPLELFKSR